MPCGAGLKGGPGEAGMPGTTMTSFVDLAASVKRDQLQAAHRAGSKQAVNLNMRAGGANSSLDPAPARLEVRRCRARMSTELIDAKAVIE